MHVFKTHYRFFFPLWFTIAMCVQSPITLGAGHLLLCNKSQNMLGLAWVKQVIPKNTYNICVEKLLFIDHIKRHQASSLNFWETGAAECAWWSFHTARWYTTAFESSSAHLWLSNHKGCLGFGEILGLSKSYTNHAYHVNTTHGISFLWDRRWVPKADLFPRGCT